MFRRKSQGFSLLEMVVVIAIILMLAALVVPLLMKTGVAHRLRCQSNLRQLGALVLQYAEQHGGRLPDFRYGRWCGAIGAVDGGVYTWESLPSGPTVWFIDERDARVFHCGAQPLPLLNTQGVRSSYGGLATNALRSIRDFEEPAGRVLLFEFEHDPAQVLESVGTPQKITYAYDSFEPESGPIRVARNHPGGGHILFLDLHVELVDGPKLDIGYWEEEYEAGSLSGRR
jgi:prepilin-type N-terminal cleavage/methylation domain-containing protein/prepilin-type processing-associated H-X9-DG protein